MPGARRSARDWLVDVTLFLFALVLGVFVAGRRPRRAHRRAVGARRRRRPAASAIAIWWRRPHPRARSRDRHRREHVLRLRRRRRARRAVQPGHPRRAARHPVGGRGLARRAPPSTALIYPDPDTPLVLEIALGALFLVLAVGWGLFVRAQRDLVQTLHQRAEQFGGRAAPARGAGARRRAPADRRRDARRARAPHLAAHRARRRARVQPGPGARGRGGRRHPGHRPRRAGRAARRDRRAARRTRPTAPPQPTLDAIPALVEESRAAGMNVTARIDADGRRRRPRPHRLPHRAGGPDQRPQARAGRARRRQRSARGRRAAGAGGQPRRAPARSSPGTGTGLIGLAERVALAGGELRHGPDARGDFVLSATLPWP